MELNSKSEMKVRRNKDAKDVRCSRTNLAGAGVFEQLNNGAHSGAADDWIVDEDDALSLKVADQSAEFLGYAQLAKAVTRLDERAADVPVAAQHLSHKQES